MVTLVLKRLIEKKKNGPEFILNVKIESFALF
jgi:hypothetical protein